MTIKYDPQLRMIPIQQISVLNPRDRGKNKFSLIVANIAKLGLKKPVTVSHTEGTNGNSRYTLVCGQGRLEAYIQLGQQEIPAIVVEGTKEDLLLMSLAENLARRRHSSVELVREISALKERGYSHTEISKKTDLHVNYVRAIIQLLARGEDRLLQAVEKGQLPVNIAITIATADDKAVQRALQEAYEHHDLRGKSLIRARRLIENRRVHGKKPRSGSRRSPDKAVSTDALLKTFQQETVRQKMMVNRAKVCETRLLFTVSAVRRLLDDQHFLTLLRAEKLDTLPEPLALHLESTEAHDDE